MFQAVNLENIDVMCVVVQGVKNSSQAFSCLETRLGTLRGRKFYGVLSGNTESGIYRACVLIKETDDSNRLRLEKWQIPGGKYIREKIKNWEKNTDLIGIAFSKMARLNEVDLKRPIIEFYRSQKELVLYLPIR